MLDKSLAGCSFFDPSVQCRFRQNFTESALGKIRRVCGSKNQSPTLCRRWRNPQIIQQHFDCSPTPPHKASTRLSTPEHVLGGLSSHKAVHSGSQAGTRLVILFSAFRSPLPLSGQRVSGSRPSECGQYIAGRYTFDRWGYTSLLTRLHLLRCYAQAARIRDSSLQNERQLGSSFRQQGRTGGHAEPHYKYLYKYPDAWLPHIFCQSATPRS